MNKFSYKNLTPFKWFVLENFPFIEADFDALTEWQLFCKLGKEINKIIDSQNVVGTQMENVTNAFIDLQNDYIEKFNNLQEYVNNYFDNLDVQEEINNKLNEMAQSGELGNIVGEYALKKLDYFKITSTMTEDEIIDILENNIRAKVVEFENSEYIFTKRIHLKSNTTIILNGASIINYSDVGIIGYEEDSSYTVYNGIHNVKIINGIINTGIALMHNSNIEFNNIEFGKNIRSHAFQIGGCKDIKIVNCIFNGTTIDDASGTTHELIQLETCTRAGQPFLNDENSISYDHTGNYNIQINYNTFNQGDGVNTRNYVDIGHHSIDSDNIYGNKNIEIGFNTFINTIYSGISISMLNNFSIHDNIFEQTNVYDGQSHIRLRFYNKNGKIYNNTLQNGNILNVNVQTQDNIDIYNNKIDNSLKNGACISLQGWKNSNIYNNYFKAKRYGTYIAQPSGTETSNLNITNNVYDMTDIQENGFGIASYGGTNINISNNTVYQNNSADPFFYTNGTTSYTYNNNLIINEAGTTVNDISGLNIDFTNVFNSIRNLYNGTASYSEITNQTVNWSFDKFNALYLLIHKHNDAGIMQYIKIKPYSLGQKLDPRSYPILMNIDGTTHYATFTINNDGTFSFTSDGQIVLRKLDAFNELLM